MFHWKCTKRLEALEDKVERLERDLKSATLDYLDIYAKAKRLFGRIAKSEARAEAEQVSGEASMVVNGTAIPTVPLTPRQQLIQRQIEERRRLNGGENVLPR